MVEAVTPSRTSSRTPPPLWLPDFCAPGSVLATVLIAELVAVLLTLAVHDLDGHFWSGLAHASLFLLWAGLGSAAALCAARARLHALDVRWGSALALLLLLLVTGVVSEAAWWLTTSPGRLLGLEAPTGSRGHMGFLLRNLAICAIAGGLALRYLYVTQQWRRNVQAEAQSRVRALQARIRPHFLFNSMNTIAALIRSRPALAEQAIADLSDLFRASLREYRERIPLADEVEIARSYERVERLRLGERLTVEWALEALPVDTLIPALVLQPLLENAVYHGIEPLATGGTISIRGGLEGSHALITIENPVQPRLVARRPGHSIGLDNVRQRIDLLYHGEASLEVIETADRFIVVMRLPLKLDQS